MASLPAGAEFSCRPSLLAASEEGLELEVEVEDSEPDFLDRLIEVVPDTPKKAAETPKKDAGSDDMDFFT